MKKKKNYVKKFMERNLIDFNDVISFPNVTLPPILIAHDYKVMTFRSNSDKTLSYWIEDNYGYSILVRVMSGAVDFTVNKTEDKE
jgi:hypothetical protein